ncbi:hypothetical protein [Viridibacillus arvi]|uniref:hypothetical protein n=1 Tax=Viridibacillus arvi TaxID=263475 RepID=UPI003CFD3545
MGKFNLKFVKPVASLAIGAAVLTGSFAVTGAADTAFAKAATVKVSKGKLVSAKSGKAVKGYKSYKGILYKNGKKFTGLYKNTYYKSGKKGTGLYKNVYYKAGKKGSGWVGSGSSKKWYQDGKLLTGLGKNSGKLFIKGKYANGIVTYKGVEKLYKDGVVVKTVVDAAKAINNTTVEVTFAEAQKASDISAGRFKIEGLEVTNASVKQTDDKVIVLTTAAQTGGKTYTVALDGVKSRTFKGVSNVLPTAITNQTPSLQGIIGKEVTVKTQVEVPAGQSKEGIAVTFNITNSADTSRGDFGKKITAEAFTDANGVASYSYTQYVAGTQDTVEVYPTGNASVKDTAAKVYWGNTERLTVADVTEASTLTNDAKKVYKISSAENAGGYVNVTFKENVNVNPDKLVRSVKVADASIYSNNSERLPYQVTTGGVQYVQVKLDASGNATFTVQGSDATVTPIVFADGSYSKSGSTVTESNWTGDFKLGSTELQATAKSVTFGKAYTQNLEVKAIGEQRAAYDKSKTSNDANDVNSGGRSYTVTVTDKDGKVAYEGTKVYVAFKANNVSKFGDVQVNGTTLTGTTGTTSYKELTVGKNGQVTFKVTGTKDGYVTPTVFINNSKDTVIALDDNDLQVTGETTYFVNPIVKDAVLSVDDADNKVDMNKPATFTYQSVDQNGFDYASDYNDGKPYDVSFEVSAKFADVTVKDHGTVKAGTTNTFTVRANANGEASIEVKSDGVPADVTVNASASQASLPNKSEKVSFVKDSSPEVPAEALALINGSVNEAAIRSALSSIANYASLSTDGKNYVVAEILKERQANRTVSSIYVSKLIDGAESAAKAVKAAAALLTAQTDVTAIPALTATNQAVVEAAIAKAEASIKVAKDLDASVTTDDTATAIAGTKIGTKNLKDQKAAVAAVKIPAAVSAAQTDVDAIPALIATNRAVVEAAIAKAEASIKAAKDLDASVTTDDTATAIAGTKIGTKNLKDQKDAITAVDVAAFKADADVVAALAIDPSTLTKATVTDAETQYNKAITKYNALSAAAKAGVSTEKSGLDKLKEAINLNK